MITNTTRTRQGLVAACTIAVALSGFAPKKDTIMGLRTAYAQQTVEDPDALIKDLEQTSPYGTEKDGMHSDTVDKLVKLGPPVVPKLIEALKNEKTKRWVVRALGDIKDPRALIPLTEMLDSADKDMRTIASAAIVDIAKADPKNPDIAKAVHMMIGMLGDDSKQESTIQELGEIGAPTVAPLIGALGNKDPKVRKGAAAALGKTGDVWAVRGLVERLDDENEDVWEEALGSLGTIAKANPGNPEVVKAIGLLIKKFKNDEKRESAIQELVEIGAPAVTPLIEALKDKNPKVREGAVKSLGEIKDARALPALRRISRSDPNEKVGNAADDSIKKIEAELNSSS